MAKVQAAIHLKLGKAQHIVIEKKSNDLQNLDQYRLLPSFLQHLKSSDPAYCYVFEAIMCDDDKK